MMLTRRLLKTYFWFALAGAVGSNLVHAEGSAGRIDWKIVYDGPRGPRYGEGELTRVCLYHDTDAQHAAPKQTFWGYLSGATKPPFRHGWKSSAADSSSQCEATLLVDISASAIFLGFDVPLDLSAGVPELRCVPDDKGMWDSRCNSVFLRRDDAPNYMVVDTKTVYAIITEAEVAALLDKTVADNVAKAAEAERLAYTNVKTLSELEAFEKTAMAPIAGAPYKTVDPANLIPEIRALKSRLSTQQYRDDYANAKSIHELSIFVAKYRGSDPDQLVAQAENRLMDAQQRETEKQSRADHVQKVADLEDQIRGCKSRIIAAQRAIDRENRAGAISGYVNATMLARAGETIEASRELIPEIYAEYRSAGGIKSLASIH